MGLAYDPYSEEVRTNPGPIYARLRAEQPVYFIEQFDAWALSKFEDVWQASLDGASYTAANGTSMDALFKSSSRPPSVFLFKDPPEHSLHRNLIRAPYLKDGVAELETKVRGLVRNQLALQRQAGAVEVYSLSSQVALAVIADLIGLELPVILKVRTLIDGFYRRRPGVDGVTPEGAEAFAELHDYLLELIAQLRRDPPDPATHVGAWLAGGARLDAIDDEALVFSIFAMTVTGSDTVPLSTAATVYYLAAHPDQMAAVRTDSSLVAHAFEEATRFDQPTNVLGRTVRREVEIRGQRIKPGQKVLFLYASACRDEQEFEAADQFRIDRRPERTLAFGAGAHSCLGQHLARLEGRVIVEELLAAAPELVVDVAACRRVYGEFLQGFNYLPIELRG
ncbi:MAG: cytochrome P450 [Caulobacteraceae bacterium]|nr:cytochrome P450 [Caulobacteraceae bacterium]